MRIKENPVKAGIGGARPQFQFVIFLFDLHLKTSTMISYQVTNYEW